MRNFEHSLIASKESDPVFILPRDPKTDMLWAKPFLESEALNAWLFDQQLTLFDIETGSKAETLDHPHDLQPEQASFVCAFIDGDGWKKINYDFSHDGGDDAIIGLGNSLKEIFRPTDILLRYGGDEFVALIKQFPSEYVIELEFELKKLLEDLPITILGKPHTVSASIGIASCDMRTLAASPTLMPKAAIQQAERNLVAAKQVRALRWR